MIGPALQDFKRQENEGIPKRPEHRALVLGYRNLNLFERNRKYQQPYADIVSLRAPILSDRAVAHKRDRLTRDERVMRDPAYLGVAFDPD